MKKLLAVLSLPIILLSLTSCQADLAKVSCYQNGDQNFCYDYNNEDAKHTFYTLSFNNENDHDVTIKTTNFYVFDNNQKVNAKAIVNLIDQDVNSNYVFYEGATSYVVKQGYQKTYIRLVLETLVSEDAVLYFNSKTVAKKA